MSRSVLGASTHEQETPGATGSNRKQQEGAAVCSLTTNLRDPLVKFRLEGVDEDLGNRDGEGLGGEIADRRAERNGPGELKLEHGDDRRPARVDAFEGRVEDEGVGGGEDELRLAGEQLLCADLLHVRNVVVVRVDLVVRIALILRVLELRKQRYVGDGTYVGSPPRANEGERLVDRMERTACSSATDLPARRDQREIRAPFGLHTDEGPPWPPWSSGTLCRRVARGRG